MADQDEVLQSHNCGSITVGPEQVESGAGREKGTTISITSRRCVWTPSQELTPQLPPSFSLSMRCVTCPDGIRRFYPVDHFDGFVANAFAGGLALLCYLKDLPAETRQSYRNMWFHFQRVQETREHFNNALDNASSLQVTRAGRGNTKEGAILPESIGLNRQLKGSRWGTQRLLSEGAKEAKEQGINKPSEEDLVHFGFIRAARLNPLQLEPGEVRRLLRLALYEGCECPTKLDEATREAVIERALKAVANHLADTSPEFDKWFSGPNNSFIQQLAKQKRATGGVQDPDLVRRVLSDLGWEAYTYVADTIHTMMRVFQRRLPLQLTEDESRWFEQMHLKQPHFGELPLVLFVERFRFLRLALWEIWNNPADPIPIGVLHRLLDYYGEMATQRRVVDRLVQDKQAGKRTDRMPLEFGLEILEGRNSKSTDDDETADDETADDEMTDDETADDEMTDDETADDETADDEMTDDDPTDDEMTDDDPTEEADRNLPKWAIKSEESQAATLFRKVAELVRELHKVRCNCEAPEWDDRVVVNDAAPDQVTISHDCTNCKYSRQTTTPITQVQEITASLVAD